MDADAHFQAVINRLGFSSVTEISESQLVEIALKFAIWPSVATYRDSPWLAPFAVRRIRIRVEPNAPGSKRDLWGLPTEDGYFTDDNSLIKSLALRRPLFPKKNPYGGAAITRGLVCCHIWPGTTASPLLFSFVPNLVWLPKSLATYSDAHSSAEPHQIHQALKQVSIERFGSVKSKVRVGRAWQLLDHPTPQLLNRSNENELADDGKISNLVIKRVDRMICFLEATLEANSTMPQRFSKRYHAGVGPGIDQSVWPVQKWLTKDVRLKLLDEMRSCL